VRLAATFAGGLLLLAACTGREAPGTPPDDEAVVLSLRNDSGEPLRCRILFGHWVEQDLGHIAPGTERELALRRQRSDGALFLPRDSDGRRMMIENLVCGPSQGWWERRADISLVPLRAGAEPHFVTSCVVTDRVHCPVPVAP
jgi:hypothetical protein